MRGGYRHSTSPRRHFLSRSGGCMCGRHVNSASEQEPCFMGEVLPYHSNRWIWVTVLSRLVSFWCFMMRNMSVYVQLKRPWQAAQEPNVTLTIPRPIVYSTTLVSTPAGLLKPFRRFKLQPERVIPTSPKPALDVAVTFLDRTSSMLVQLAAQPVPRSPDSIGMLRLRTNNERLIIRTTTPTWLYWITDVPWKSYSLHLK